MPTSSMRQEANACAHAISRSLPCFSVHRSAIDHGTLFGWAWASTNPTRVNANCMAFPPKRTQSWFACLPANSLAPSQGCNQRLSLKTGN